MKTMLEKIGIIGITVAQGNMRLLERLTLPTEQRALLLPELKAALGVDELVYLATCNRVEFIFCQPRGQSVNSVRNRLLDYFLKSGPQITFTPGDIFAHSGREAIGHIFRVTSSLESMVIGETQITGQIKTALAASREAGATGSELERLIKEALLVARKIRNETKIGSGSLSMASLVIGELHNVASFSEESTIALVGAGEMTSKMAAYLKKLLPAQILFVNRTEERAQELAQRFSGRSISLECFLANPGKIAAIISATGSPRAVFGKEFMERMKNQNEHVMCVDLAIPRDFSSDYDESDMITLIDIPHLNENKDKNLRGKFRELDKAGGIIETAAEDFANSYIEQALKPALDKSRLESLEFAREKCETLFSERLIRFSPKERELVYELIEKVLGRAQAAQRRAFAGHLSKLSEAIAIETAQNEPVEIPVDTGASIRYAVHSIEEPVSEI